jgi:hypothetical protein
MVSQITEFNSIVSNDDSVTETFFFVVFVSAELESGVTFGAGGGFGSGEFAVEADGFVGSIRRPVEAAETTIGRAVFGRPIIQSGETMGGSPRPRTNPDGCSFPAGSFYATGR